MDSIVDAFFPLIDYIESESNEVDTFLSDPLNPQAASTVPTKVAPSGVGNVAGRRVYDEDVVGLVIEQPTSNEKAKGNLGASASFSMKKATVRRNATTSVLRWLPALPLPNFAFRILPQSWATRTTRTFESTMLVDGEGYKLYPLSSSLPVEGVALREDEDDVFAADTKFDRGVMLRRIADTRKLITGLSRILGPKMDVVRGLRKRTKDDAALFGTSDARQDIAIYIGDLYGGPRSRLSTRRARRC
jgi:Mg2+ and Co2+ transporter CorA